MQNAECRNGGASFLHFAFCIRAAAAEVESMLVIKFGGTEPLRAKTVL